MGLSPSKMFFRLLLRSATVRRGRTLTALFAIAVAATLATALLNLYGDIDAKLSGDFRKFGANVLVSSPNGFSDADIHELERGELRGAITVPSAFAVAKTASGRPIVVVGTDLANAKRLNPSWLTTGTSANAITGTRARKALAAESDGGAILYFSGSAYTIGKSETLETGGPEDSRLYLPLEDFERWTHVRPTLLEASIPGTSGEVRETIEHLRAKLSGRFTVEPARQIVEAETRVLGKSRFILLLSSIAITLTVALCVLATLTSSVLERRKDYAVMKALGSSQGRVNAIFVGETLALAVLGAMVGFVAGGGLAMWIGEANFHTSVALRWNVFPYVLAGCVLVAAVSGLVPLSILQKTQPATMLKGE